MLTEAESKSEMPEKKRKLIDATVGLILAQGYNATTVDQICQVAGVTKGSFFYYFANKEEIGLAAMDAWSAAWEGILLAAELEKVADPLDRLARLFDVMEEAYLTPEIPSGCVVGTVAQELGACNRSLGGPSEIHLDVWAQGVIRLLTDAKAAHPPKVDFDPVGVADFMLGMVQGTLLVTKVRQNRRIVPNNVGHLRAYVLGLFGRDAHVPVPEEI